MKWPKVDRQKSFEELERRLEIAQEVNDIRPSSLGAHPSASFYSERKPQIDLAKMRGEV